MNERFKFRYWDTAQGNWKHEFKYFQLEPENPNIIGLTLLALPLDRPNRYIIQQFTGLKDKNGKEIYEGDIVSIFEYLNGELWHGHHHNASIIFQDGKFTFSPIWQHQKFSKYGNEVVIIGNIFENPQLLND